jgi:hypothetical protein
VRNDSPARRRNAGRPPPGAQPLQQVHRQQQQQQQKHQQQEQETQQWQRPQHPPRAAISVKQPRARPHYAGAPSIALFESLSKNSNIFKEPLNANAAGMRSDADVLFTMGRQ